MDKRFEGFFKLRVRDSGKARLSSDGRGRFPFGALEDRMSADSL